MSLQNEFSNTNKIRNVIFDFGQVLVRFEPEYFCREHVSDDGDVKLLCDVLFARKYWDRLDAGTISDEELLESVKKEVPEHLHDACEKIYYGWIYRLPEIEGMRDVIALCRQKGYGVYLLSNISQYFAEHENEIPILSLLDGTVLSATAGAVKPDPEIFDHITKKFDLTPCETLFVDDNLKNVEGANKFGIISYHFDGDAKRLYDFINRLT